MDEALAGADDPIPRLRRLRRRQAWIASIGLTLAVMPMTMLGLGYY